MVDLDPERGKNIWQHMAVLHVIAHHINRNLPITFQSILHFEHNVNISKQRFAAMVMTIYNNGTYREDYSV